MWLLYIISICIMNIMNVGFFTFGRQLIGIFGQLRVEINLLCQPTPTIGKYQNKEGGGGLQKNCSFCKIKEMNAIRNAHGKKINSKWWMLKCIKHLSKYLINLIIYKCIIDIRWSESLDTYITPYKVVMIIDLWIMKIEKLINYHAYFISPRKRW